jgi:hypothetical protein
LEAERDSLTEKLDTARATIENQEVALAAAANNKTEAGKKDRK